MEKSNLRNYEEIVELIRREIPQLSIEEVKRDIEAAVKNIGISIKYAGMFNEELKDVSGYVHVENGKPEIVVNFRDVETRRRFTIAHELGHIFLHWQWLPNQIIEDDLVEISYRNGEYTREERIREREADSFAAEFLAPVKFVKKSVQSYLEDGIVEKEEQIDKLAREYKLSNGTAYYLWRDINRELNNGN